MLKQWADLFIICHVEDLCRAAQSMKQEKLATMAIIKRRAIRVQGMKFDSNCTGHKRAGKGAERISCHGLTSNNWPLVESGFAMVRSD